MDPPGRLRPRRDRAGAQIADSPSGSLLPRAVGFDIDHTLGIDNKLERVAFLRLLDEIWAAGGRAAGTLWSESRRIDDLLARQRSGAFSIDDAVARFVSERGVENVQPFVARYKQIVLESVPEFFVPQPDAPAVLEALKRRGIACAILSNGWSPLQQEKARCLSFEGPVLVSDQIGAQKPEARAFEALAQALATPAASIAYVGDNPRGDAAAAAAFGMQAIWYDAEGVRYPRDLPKPAAVIHTLTELLALL